MHVAEKAYLHVHNSLLWEFEQFTFHLSLFFFPQELDIFSHGTLVHTCTCQPFKIAMVAN